MVLRKLIRGLHKTRARLGSSLQTLLRRRKLDAEFLEELEEILFTADMGTSAMSIVAQIEEGWRANRIRDVGQVFDHLRAALEQRLEGCGGELQRAPEGPTVLMVCGVNGSGKTTSIAKLAHHLGRQGHSVMLAAADTFRAAAVEQLGIWAERLGVAIIRKDTSADPAAVAFDASRRAAEQGIDYLIVDTAGRLHTQKNLMAELEKIRRVLGRNIPGAPHEVLLVLDATTGQNAIVQAQQFSQAVEVSGLILAKLDGTAKGGAVFGIREKLAIPVKFIGLGEKLEDLEIFDAEEFTAAILARDEVPAAE